MSDPADLGGPLIMLVEDNDHVRDAFGTLLREMGYRVIDAADGTEAIELAHSDLPDLILMDLGLPDINGLEVTRRLKAEEATRNIVVVALTGRALAADLEECLEAGCAGHLSKPVETRHLLRMIPEFLRE